MEKGNFIKSFDVCVSQGTYFLQKYTQQRDRLEARKRRNIFTNYLQNMYTFIKKGHFGKPIGPVPPTSILQHQQLEDEFRLNPFLFIRGFFYPSRIQTSLKGHGNEPNFPMFSHNSGQHTVGLLHHLSSRSNFGFEFVEILTDAGSRRLPVSTGELLSDKILQYEKNIFMCACCCRYPLFQLLLVSDVVGVLL